MNSINTVCFSGNIANDAKITKFENGGVINFAVCVTSRVKNGEEWDEYPNFVNCSLFGSKNRIKALSQLIIKGARCLVSGELRQDKWEADDGSKRSALTVRVHEIEISPRRSHEDSAKDEW